MPAAGPAPRSIAVVDAYGDETRVRQQINIGSRAAAEREQAWSSLGAEQLTKARNPEILSCVLVAPLLIEDLLFRFGILKFSADDQVRNRSGKCVPAGAGVAKNVLPHHREFAPAHRAYQPDRTLERGLVQNNGCHGEWFRQSEVQPGDWRREAEPHVRLIRRLQANGAD